MDFLSKLLGKDRKNIEKTAKGLFTGPTGGKQTEARPVSGFSWGDEMPDEENQYNYNGTFMEYFESIFREELPQYRMNRTLPSNSKRVLYTFFSGSSMALVVELMSEGCSVNRIRSDCRRDGIPYLRFYYDHHGWWNTRAYVVKRLRDAVSR